MRCRCPESSPRCRRTCMPCARGTSELLMRSSFASERNLLEQSSNSATRPARRSARRELRYRRSRASARLRCSSPGIWPVALTVSTHFSRSVDWASTSAMSSTTYTDGWASILSQTFGVFVAGRGPKRMAPSVHTARVVLREPQLRRRRQPISQQCDDRREVSQRNFHEGRSHGVAIPTRSALA